MEWLFFERETLFDLLLYFQCWGHCSVEAQEIVDEWMNEWHRERRDGETDTEKWMGLGSKSMGSTQWHLWCAWLVIGKSQISSFLAKLCICKLDLGRGKEDNQAAVICIGSAVLVLPHSYVTLAKPLNLSKPLYTYSKMD